MKAPRGSGSDREFIRRVLIVLALTALLTVLYGLYGALLALAVTIGGQSR